MSTPATIHASAQPLISYPGAALRGEATAPGDKSISHRVFMIASQAIGKTEIYGVLEGEDVLNTARALQALGVPMARQSTGHWEINGVGTGGLQESNTVLDMGNSGTGARLLMGLLTPYPFTSFFTGDASLRARPMQRVIAPLSQMGATFTARAGGRLPLALTGTGDALPITYALPVPSAQVKSAILLAGLNIRGETSVIERERTRDHTEHMLTHFGFACVREETADGLSIRVTGQQKQLRADRRIDVPGDPSSAAFLAVAALITEGSSLLIRNVCINPLRAGLFETLRAMGANLDYRNPRRVAGEDVADIAIKSSRLKAVCVPASRAPSMIDEYPILAVAAAFAEGETAMKGIGELRVKESDRLSAILDGLKTNGVTARAEGDTLFVTGQLKPKGGGTVSARLDHRIAMSFLIMGMATEAPIKIDDASSINTSFPGFADMCNRLGGRMETPIGGREKPLLIAIDGPAASGKGTLARRVAEHFGIAYLDTGSLYRAVGLKLAYNKQDASDTQAAIAAAKAIDYEDLTNPRLRQEHIGKAASLVSAMPEVRAILLEFQRKFGLSGKGAVLDGRDIGTVVFPQADFKFYLTATLEARARRRHRELSGQGVEVVYGSVLADLRERDARDAEREIAPLKPAADAIIIDTSTMDANSVFEKVKQLVTKERGSR